MESAFGHSLGHVRIHDDATAARAARDVDARAFTLGDHLAFHPDSPRPDTPLGRGLLAHELVHTLQGGISDDARAESEAHAAVAALARGERPSIVRHPGPPRLHRAPRTAAAPPPVPAPVPTAAPGPGAAASTPAPQPGSTAGPALRLPEGLSVVTDEPRGIGTSELVVRLDQFTLPLHKGAGPWVQQAHTDAAGGGRLVFTPVIQSNSVASFKEGREDYKSVWLGKYGFTSTRAMADAFTASTDPAVRASLEDPEVRRTVTGLRTGLRQAGCDVDHIVEKQMGGTSIPSNLQLLTSTANQASGRQTYQALVDVVNEIRQPAMRGPNVRRLQIRIGRATVPEGASDPSFVIEDHLRAGRVTGSDAVRAQAAGKPVSLTAGGVGETVSVRDTGETPLDAMSRRIVPGMRLTTYRRGPGGARSRQDTVLAELDSRAVRTTGEPSSLLRLLARPPARPPAGTPAAAAQPATGEAPDATVAAPGEARELGLDRSTANQRIAFYYPYLSPGVLTSFSLDDQGHVSATGVIRPTIPIFGPLQVTYSREVLALAAPLDKSKLRSPLPGVFRFTGGELGLQLSPELVPRGTVTFAVGPAARPLLNGDLTMAMTGGVLTATGTLTPAGRIPGVAAASGRVQWSSTEGWSGRVNATSDVPGVSGSVEIGFRGEGGRLQPYAEGELVTRIRDAELRLGAAWRGQSVVYSGGVTVTRPFPMVESVRLRGRYSDRGLFLEGDAPIRWRTVDSTIHLEYRQRPDQPEGRFSGRATFNIRTAKAEGALTLDYDDAGRFRGRGTIAYQVTPNLRPTLGIELTRDQRIKMFGGARLNDLALTRKWPSPEGGRLTIIRGVGVRFNIPTPVPAVTAYGEIKGSLGLEYGVGPVMLRGVVFTGELYPLEDDPQIRANLKGAFAVPAYAELYGTFGAYIGLEVALGAVGAKGGVEITPRLRISGEGGVAVDATYESGGFSFAAEAYATGRLNASATVDLVADLYAAYGYFSHRWTYRAASVSAQIGPTVRLTLGRIAYSRTGEMTWPQLSQVRMDPESIDPLEVVRDMLRRGEARES